jgi:hypothetical protein
MCRYANSYILESRGIQHFRKEIEFMILSNIVKFNFILNTFHIKAYFLGLREGMEQVISHPNKKQEHKKDKRSKANNFDFILQVG